MLWCLSVPPYCKALNSWLSPLCTVHSVHFVDNFSLFWDHRHLFKADGLCLNKSGVKCFICNLFSYPFVPSAKDKRKEESKQEVDITQQSRKPEEEQPQPSHELSFNHERHQRKVEEDAIPPSPIPVSEDYPP